MKKKILFSLAMVMMGFTFLTGCNDEVITVADNMNSSSAEGEGTEYIELETFEIQKEQAVEREGIGYCAILIPADFVQSEEVPGMYISKRYPLDSGNIYYTVTNSADIGAVSDELSKESYVKAIESAYEAMGDSIKLKVDDFSKETLEGVPCYKIRSHYNIGDRDVQQLTYIIMAADTHVITYTQASDDDLLVDFLKDEGQIKLVREISQAER